MMLETHAIIVYVQGNEALVETKGGGGCGHCNGEQGCGSDKLAKVFCAKPRQFKVKNQINAKVGDEVLVVLPDGVLLIGSILMYLLPLVMLFGGALLGARWSSDASDRDVYSAIGSLSGLFVGFSIAKWFAAYHQVSAEARRIEQLDTKKF